MSISEKKLQIEEVIAMVFDSVKDINKKFGKFNILIVGKTGVGKSTLINAIFAEDVAKVGQGKPCTQDIIKYECENFNLFDTKGLELEDYTTITDEIVTVLNTRAESENPNEHIHIVLFCIDGNGERIEKGEIDILKAISTTNTSTICVVTKAYTQQAKDFTKIIEKILQDSNIKIAKVMPVLAQAVKIDEETTIKPKGLEELLEEMIRLCPEAAQNALAASQKISLKYKISTCNKIIATAATAAGVVGLSPIPFSDAVLLVPVQIGMLAGISKTFNISLTEKFLTSIIMAFAASGGAAIVGRTFVSNLLKFIPGIGSIAGGTISATTASVLTTGLGKLYLGIIEDIAKDDPAKKINPDDIITAVKSKLNI